MGDTIKGIFLIILGLIGIYIPASCVIGCVNKCQDEAKIVESNTEIVLLIDGPDIRDEYDDGEVINYVSVGFKNVGKETVYRVSCKVHLYDSDNFLIGTLTFNYDPSNSNAVEYGQSTPRHVMHITTVEGEPHASYIKITDLKVNGYNKEPRF